MEKIGDEQEKLKFATAIRCAKAAILISSLKNCTQISPANNSDQLQIDEKIEVLKSDKLKLEHMMKKLVKEKRNLRLWIRVCVLSIFFPCFLIMLMALVNCL